MNQLGRRCQSSILAWMLALGVLYCFYPIATHGHTKGISLSRFGLIDISLTGNFAFVAFDDEHKVNFAKIGDRHEEGFNAAAYRTNYEQFAAKLKDKVQHWDELMVPFRGTPVVSYHRSWTYLAKRHGLQVVAYVEPKETIPPSAAEMAALVARMRKHGSSLS